MPQSGKPGAGCRIGSSPSASIRTFRLLALVVLVFTSALAPGCARDSTLNVNVSGLSNLSLFDGGDRAVVLDGAGGRLLWVPSRGDAVQAEPIEGAVSEAVPGGTGGSLVLLQSEEERLTVVTGPGAKTSYELKSSFDRLHLSSDGKRAVLLHSGAGSGVVSNAGEVVTVALDTPPGSENPRRRTIHASTDGPIGFTYGPAMDILGSPHRLGLVHLRDGLALISVDRPDLEETLISLAPSGAPAVRPSLVRFEAAPRPDGSQAAAAMRAALRVAGLEPSAVDHINAHGSSTPLNDSTESLAIRLALGAHADRVTVSGTKPFYGHALGASGAIELAICALAIQRGWVPPTLNLEEAGEGCDLRYVNGVGRDQRVRTVLSNSFGFGGINASMVLSEAGAHPPGPLLDGGG